MIDNVNRVYNNVSSYPALARKQSKTLGLSISGGSMVHYSKQPTTIKQQIHQLQTEGMVISDTAKAEQVLECIAYYRLRAYWIIFEVSNNPRRFKPNTKFEDVLNLYLFDEVLRNLVFNAITTIEISLRATFSNLTVIFNNSHFYLESKYFKRVGVYIESLHKVKRTVEKNKDELFIAHYLKNYKYPELPPVWSIAEILTIGELYYWITNLNDNELDKIAKKYGFFNRDVFSSALERLSIIRNICAHHNRLWNKRIVKKRLKQIQQKNMLKEAFDKGIKSEETFYGNFCYIAYILRNIDKNVYNATINQFKKLIKNYNINPTEMGFPIDWQLSKLFV